MVRVILVDDEYLAVQSLKRLLTKYEDIEVIGEYTDWIPAAEALKKDDVDVIFLDIEMPQINGLNAAREILKVSPNTKIIFVTAYSEYAIDSYEINALDYLLKPVSKNRLDNTISRIRSSIQQTPKKEEEVKFKVVCFGAIDIISSAHKKAKWRTLKTKELFAFLLEYRNTVVQKNKILENLWYDLDEEKAIPLLHTSVYNIRKMSKDIGIDNCIEYSNEGYMLVTNGMSIDVEEFQRILKTETKVNEDSISNFEKAISLYRGDYLENNDFIWASFERERLKNLYINGLIEMADYYMKKKQYSNAIESLKKILQVNSLLQEINEKLLTAYALNGDYQSLIKHYNDYQDYLSEELGIEPSPKTRNLFYKLCVSANNIKDM